MEVKVEADSVYVRTKQGWVALTFTPTPPDTLLQKLIALSIPVSD